MRNPGMGSIRPKQPCSRRPVAGLSEAAQVTGRHRGLKGHCGRGSGRVLPVSCTCWRALAFASRH